MGTICKIHEVQYREAFRRVRQKATPARLAILEVLEHVQKPFSAEDIKAALGGNRIDLATVYRNLELLKTNGWILPVNLDSQTSYYELARREHHHHLVCETCGQVAELPDCGVKAVPASFSKKMGFAKITRHSLEYFGLCQKCSNK